MKISLHIFQIFKTMLLFLGEDDSATSLKSGEKIASLIKNQFLLHIVVTTIFS